MLDRGRLVLSLILHRYSRPSLEISRPSRISALKLLLRAALGRETNLLVSRTLILHGSAGEILVEGTLMRVLQHQIL